MTNEPKQSARAFVLARLAECPDISALQRVWSSLGLTYQKDPEVFRFKEEMKRVLS